MEEIWANELLPNALKSCPKSNKSPNLGTLVKMDIIYPKKDAIPGEL